jgi:hypothetical protein
VFFINPIRHLKVASAIVEAALFEAERIITIAPSDRFWIEAICDSTLSVTPIIDFIFITQPFGIAFDHWANCVSKMQNYLSKRLCENSVNSFAQISCLVFSLIVEIIGESLELFAY